jgi:outer membrane protein
LISSFLQFAIASSSKNVDVQECVNYALENNITIKQTELDGKTALIDKKGAFGRFLSVNANASHSWNIGLNQDITTGYCKTKQLNLPH